MYLVSKGVPFDTAFNWFEASRIDYDTWTEFEAALIVLQELDGGRFDWDMMRWKSSDEK